MYSTCKKCQKEFYIEAKECLFYQSKGYELPKHCLECRHDRRIEKKIDLKDMIGKEVVRTEKNKNGDRSFLNQPILILDVDDTFIHYQTLNGKNHLFTKSWNDGFWKEFKVVQNVI